MNRLHKPISERSLTDGLDTTPIAGYVCVEQTQHRDTGSQNIGPVLSKFQSTDLATALPLMPTSLAMALPF